MRCEEVRLEIGGRAVHSLSGKDVPHLLRELSRQPKARLFCYENAALGVERDQLKSWLVELNLQLETEVTHARRENIKGRENR